MNRPVWLACAFASSLAACQTATSTPGDGGTSDAPANADLAPAAPTGPSLLSKTGLYSDFASRTLAAGVLRYTTQFPVWTDGTAGDSYLLLPAGAQIDSSDPDRWVFPVGTRSWREVRLGDVLLETRFLEKQREGENGWFEMGYQWDAGHTEATAAPDGADRVLGTSYGILSQDQCHICHDHMRDTLIGVSAVQLSRPTGNGPLAQLAARGLLSLPPAADFQVPGNALEQAALAYLHSNCGYCHNQDSRLRNILKMNLDLRTGDRVVADTATYRTAINARMFHPMPPDIDIGVVPRDSARSQVWARMALRDDWAMPNLDTALVDDAGLQLIKDWIDALPK